MHRGLSVEMTLSKRKISFLTIPLLILAILFLGRTALADNRSEQLEKSDTWQELDPSNAEHAAIQRWHKSLLLNDFDAYLRSTDGVLPGLNEKSMRVLFDNIRKSTPPKLLVTTNPYVRANGSKDFSVAGCLKADWDTKEMRMVAEVIVAKKGEEFFIIASGFAAPWNDLKRACPVK